LGSSAQSRNRRRRWRSAHRRNSLWALRSLRRGRQLEKSLAEATLDRDAKTHWLTLEIVMRNFQRHPLLVRSVEIIDPPGTKICDRWQAWRPETASVKFVAPELDLTDSASIEATIFPYNSNDYANRADELIRNFYVRPPGAEAAPPLALRARLICELQTRRGRRQELTFRRTLRPA
jgi:hypothetical protein